MKQILILFSLLSFQFLNGQEIIIVLNDSYKFEAEQIAEIQDKTSSEIYSSILEWISYNFQNTQAVIQSQIENKMVRISGHSNGVIEGAMNFRYGLGYTIQVDIKDNKIRIRATNLQTIGADELQTRHNIEESLLKKGKIREGKYSDFVIVGTNTELTRIFESLISAIENQQSGNENW